MVLNSKSFYLHPSSAVITARALTPGRFLNELTLCVFRKMRTESYSSTYVQSEMAKSTGIRCYSFREGKRALTVGGLTPVSEMWQSSVIMQNKPKGSYKRCSWQKRHRGGTEHNGTLALSLTGKTKNKGLDCLTSMFTFSLCFPAFKKSCLSTSHLPSPSPLRILIPLCPSAGYKEFWRLPFL